LDNIICSLMDIIKMVIRIKSLPIHHRSNTPVGFGTLIFHLIMIKGMR
jgi:hypothetical protein